jgi:BirA family biotin operon repressor/biotin-[acetyl-CoA-carboxylase] ligase
MKIEKSDILTLLRNNECYVSGQQLCDQFQVSRTAVWKVINQLKEEGYRIESVPHKGYRLVESPSDILSKGEIASRLHTKWAGRTLYYTDVTTSTNTDAKQYGEAGAPHGTTVVADMQTAGKGRRGRQWQSPAGTNIYFTILVRPTFSPDKASMLTLVMALSVAEAVEEITGLQAGIKWPNDIVINRKKVVGMLTEMAMTPELDEIQYVVIGTGVNVNTVLEELPEEIRETATSLKQESGQQVGRSALIERMLARFEYNYEIFEQTLDLSGLSAAYEQHLINVDAQVRVLDPAGEYTGISRGITETGELIVEKEDGSVANVYAGEVSVRGLYGYV